MTTIAAALTSPMFPLLSEVTTVKIPPGEDGVCESAYGQPIPSHIDPLTHILEVRMDSYLPPISMPPDLVVTLLIPNEIQRLLRMINQAYMDTLPFIPVSMEDRTPNLAPDSLPITCMVWNVQGAGSRTFVATLKEIVRTHHPNVIALVLYCDVR